MAQHTDEESVILTASVADGTLSHLGSDSGKSFLDDYEDVKSQFLGFCLKSKFVSADIQKNDVFMSQNLHVYKSVVYCFIKQEHLNNVRPLFRKYIYILIYI